MYFWQTTASIVFYFVLRMTWLTLHDLHLKVLATVVVRRNCPYKNHKRFDHPCIRENADVERIVAAMRERFSEKRIDVDIVPRT